MESTTTDGNGGSGIKYPKRKARMALSGLTLMFVIYMFGGLLFMIPAFFLVSAYGSWGWLLTLLLLSGIIAMFAYRSYRKQRDRLLADAREVTLDDDPELGRVLEFLRHEAEARGMEPPTLHVHPDMGVNAFAIGRRNGGHIVLLEGLLATLDSEEELKAIVAHELGHLDNRDSMLMSILTGIKETIVRFWTGFGYAVWTWSYQRRGVVLGPAEEEHLKRKARKRSERVCSPIGLCEKSVSRHREYIADAEAAEATSPSAVIDALESIDDSEYEPENLEVAQSLCVHGTHNGFLSRLRSTHPSMERRIRHIEKRYLER